MEVPEPVTDFRFSEDVINSFNAIPTPFLLYDPISHRIVLMNSFAEHFFGHSAPIATSGKTLTISIMDDGISFNPQLKGGGIGLSNIRNRASLYDGTIRIDSSPGNGCTLTVKFTDSRNKTPACNDSAGLVVSEVTG